MSYNPIEKVTVTADERETVININPVAKTARVYTCDSVMIRRLRELLLKNEGVAKLVNEDQYGMEIEIPAKWIKVSKPATRNMSEEQRAAFAERMRGTRKQRKDAREKKG